MIYDINYLRPFLPLELFFFFLLIMAIKKKIIKTAIIIPITIKMVLAVLAAAFVVVVPTPVNAPRACGLLNIVEAANGAKEAILN